MIFFPNGDEEIELIKFIAKFQYLHINDAHYFFKSEKYYRNRITSLVKKKYLRRTNKHLVLDKIGIEYARFEGFQYNPLNRNKKYLQRLLYLSNLGAFYIRSNNVTFNPSHAMKDREMLTSTARRYIGILVIDGVEYLTYSITAQHDELYIKNVLYDMQKERKYRNMILLINDINRINTQDFAFGYNQVLIIEDTEETREKLKYIHTIRWDDLVYDYYKDSVYLSKYYFCDYTDDKSKYIAYFYFIDTEKINLIQNFLRENPSKNIDIYCEKEISEHIKKEIPRANCISLDLEKYIDKERRIYD